MLSTAARVAARRVITTRPANAAPQLLSRSVPAVVSSPIAIRAFTASALTHASAPKESPKKSTAAKKAAAKKAVTETETKETPTKRAPLRKPSITATGAPVAPVRRKPKPKKKAKVKPKRKALKKELTPEQQEKLKELKLKREARVYKGWGLVDKEQTYLPQHPWLVYVTQQSKPGTGKSSTAIVQDLAPKFKQLYSYELEELQKTAQANKVVNEKNYKAWVETFPVERIYLANKYRRRLTLRTGKPVKPIRDERLPKHPPNGFVEFVRAKFHETKGDRTAAETISDLSKQWGSFSDSEKKPYLAVAEPQAEAYKAALEKLRADAKIVEKALKAEAAAAKAEEARRLKDVKKGYAKARRDAKVDEAAEQ